MSELAGMPEGRGRGRANLSRLPAECRVHQEGRSHDPEIIFQAKNKSQTPNRLSNPGTPQFILLTDTGFIFLKHLLIIFIHFLRNLGYQNVEVHFLQVGYQSSTNYFFLPGVHTPIWGQEVRGRHTGTSLTGCFTLRRGGGFGLPDILTLCAADSLQTSASFR